MLATCLPRLCLPLTFAPPCTSVSLDLGEDCCAPGSEIKKCTRGYTAYCKEGDRNCCPYVCCDSQPEGYYKPTQLPRYLWATFSTCLSLLLLIITVFIARLKDSRGLVYSTQTRGLGRDAKRRIKRLLDAELAQPKTELRAKGRDILY